MSEITVDQQVTRRNVAQRLNDCGRPTSVIPPDSDEWSKKPGALQRNPSAALSQENDRVAPITSRPSHYAIFCSKDFIRLSVFEQPDVAEVFRELLRLEGMNQNDGPRIHCTHELDQILNVDVTGRMGRNEVATNGCELRSSPTGRDIPASTSTGTGSGQATSLQNRASASMAETPSGVFRCLQNVFQRDPVVRGELLQGFELPLLKTAVEIDPDSGFPLWLGNSGFTGDQVQHESRIGIGHEYPPGLLGGCRSPADQDPWGKSRRAPGLEPC